MEKIKKFEILIFIPNHKKNLKRTVKSPIIALEIYRDDENQQSRF